MDFTTEPIPVSRPKEVKMGIYLLWLSIALGFLTSALQLSQRVSGTTLLLGLLIVIAFFGIYLFLVYRIWARKNWARIVLLVLVLFGLPFTVPTYIGELRKSILSGSISIFIAVLQVVGTYLLFTRNSNRWFRTRK